MQDYRIADLKVRMACEGRTQQQAESYRADFEGEPDIVIDVAEASVARERELHPELSEDDWRYMLTGGRFARDLLSYDGLVLHASAVVVDGQAYLFSAPSGGGKSTHTLLWLKRFPEAYLLNDDKPALRVDAEGRWWAYGTPWSGTYDISRNERVPLAGICFVEKGSKDRIALADDAEASVRLYAQMAKSRAEEGMAQMLTLIDRLMADIPIYLMTCTVSDHAAAMSYEAMQGGTSNE